MKNIQPYIRSKMRIAAAAGAALLIGQSGCIQNPQTPNLYNPGPGKPTPTITNVVPPGDSALAGVTSITITGTNFSSVAVENQVYFNTAAATVLQASTTQLVVRAPNVVSDTVNISIALFQGSLYSNIYSYKLKPAVSAFGNLGSQEEPYGLASDSAGNLYASLTNNGGGIGIAEFTPAGTRSSFIAAGGITFWSALKVGPGGVVYGARNQRVLYTMTAGGSPTIWVVISGDKIYDFDFDSQLNIWGGGANSVLYRFKPDKTFLTFPFVGNVRSVRVFQNYLYVAVTFDSSAAKIVRFPIVTSDSLGAPQTYFNFAGYTNVNAIPYAITFSADGDMYVGTDDQVGIFLVHASGAWEPFYPGLFQPQPWSFAWGKGTDLYMSRTGTAASHTIIKINTLKKGAPYYGRGDH